MWDCWTTCFSVGRSREDDVGQCVVGTAVVGGIGSGGDGSDDRDGRCCDVVLPSKTRRPELCWGQRARRRLGANDGVGRCVAGRRFVVRSAEDRRVTRW